MSACRSRRVALSAGVALAALACLAPGAIAAYVAVDTFESYTLNSSIDGQGGWNTGTQTNFSALVVADPANASNKVLQAANTGGTGRVFNDFQASRSGLNIATGTTGTLFARFRSSSGPVDVAFGSSDIVQATLLSLAADGARFDNFEGYGRIQTDGTQYQVRNGGGFITGANSRTISTDTWYNLWLVLNNTAATFKAYVQGPGDANPIQYLGGTATGDFAFRTGGAPHGSLISYLIDSNATSPNTYFDDIYVDTAGENLTNPATGVVITPGDVDGNGIVNLVDFGLIRDHFQTAVTMRSQGDLTFDNFVDFRDFRQWKTAFLGGGGSLEGVDLSFSGGAVPEPAGVCLALMAVCGLMQVSARRHRN